MTTVEADAFAGALKTALRGTGRSYLPVLSGVRLTVDDGTLTCTCSDLDLTVEARVPASRGGLDAIVPARTLADFVARLHDVVTLTEQDGELRVEAGESETTLRTFETTGWPKPHQIVGEPTKLTAEQLELVGRVLHAAATGKMADAKPALASAWFSGQSVVCTDSYRLAIGALNTDVPEMLVNAKRLASILQGCEDGAVVTSDDHLARFETDAATYTVRCTPSEFPAEAVKLVRAKSSHTLRANRVALVEALEITDLDKTEELPTVRLAVKDGRLVITKSVMDLGSAQHRVDATADFEFTIAFNRKYLGDMLTVATCDEVVIGLVDALKAVQVEDGALQLLVMPTGRN